MTFWIFVLAAGLRLGMGIIQKSFCFDEWASIETAMLPLRHGVIATVSDVHPPLYFILLHEAIRCLGDSEWAVRFPSMVFGIAAVPGVYFCAKKFFDKQTALLRCLLAAVLPYWVHLSYEIRNHGLPIFFCVWGTFFFLKLKEAPKKFSWGAAYWLSSISAVYSDHFAWFWLMATLTFLFPWKAVQSERLKFVRLLCGVLITTFPAFLILIYHAIRTEGIVKNFDHPHGSFITSLCKEITGIYWHFISGARFNVYLKKSILLDLRHSRLFQLSLSALLVSLTAAFFTLTRLIKEKRAHFYFFLSVCFLPPILVAWLDPGRLDPRFFGFAAPFFLMLVASGINEVKPRWSRIILTGFLILMTLHETIYLLRLPNNAERKEDYLGMVRYVATHAKKGDAIVKLKIFEYYAHQMKLKPDATLISDPQSTPRNNNLAFQRIWFMDVSPPYLENFEELKKNMSALGYEVEAGDLRFGNQTDFLTVNVYRRAARLSTINKMSFFKPL